RFKQICARKELMTAEHHQHHTHGHIEYRFCPRCGGELEKRIVKAMEPRRLVCENWSFILAQEPKVVGGTICQVGVAIVFPKRGEQERCVQRLHQALPEEKNGVIEYWNNGGIQRSITPTRQYSKSSFRRFLWRCRVWGRKLRSSPCQSRVNRMFH